MEPGELELRKIFEEVTTKNVQTTINFTQDTRKMVRELQEMVGKLERRIANQDETLQQLRVQLASIQTKVYSGGTV